MQNSDLTKKIGKERGLGHSEPILDKLRWDDTKVVDPLVYPFALEIIKNLTEIVFSNQVTFFVGENGSGKSTVLEAIATKAGLGREGGSKNIAFNTADKMYGEQIDALASSLILTWRKKPRDGYFFRAESFFNLANHIDYVASEGGQGKSTAYANYGGKSLHEQSHGESFLSLISNRLGGGGFYVFDEPEAALSPQRQLSFMRVIYDLCQHPESQFIIATHSPLLLAFPGAVIYSFDGGKIEQIQYKETSHYDITRGFLNNPEQYLKHLFND